MPHPVCRPLPKRSVAARSIVTMLAVLGVVAVPSLANAEGEDPIDGPIMPEEIPAESILFASEDSTEAEREHSATAYADISPSEAALLVENSFPELLAPLGASPIPS